MLCRVVVLRGVLVRRVIAASDVAAGKAETQVHPGVPALEALLAATRRIRRVVLRRPQVRAELSYSGHSSDDTRPSLISSSGGEHAGCDGGVPRRLEALPRAARGRPAFVQGTGGKDLHSGGTKRLGKDDVFEDGEPAHRAERRVHP